MCDALPQFAQYSIATRLLSVNPGTHRPTDDQAASGRVDSWLAGGLPWCQKIKRSEIDIHALQAPFPGGDGEVAGKNTSLYYHRG